MRTSQIQNLIIVLPKIVYWITLTPLWHLIGGVVYGSAATIPFGIGWLLWYMMCTFTISQILRKYFGLNRDLNKNP